mmetsp:Transcript_80868/g.251055  ORF Transcript_80868/g.251055 Transcript_80868/m.251055 type:complete len:217 (-) Transcript_80868:144-794(-)
MGGGAREQQGQHPRRAWAAGARAHAWVAVRVSSRGSTRGARRRPSIFEPAVERCKRSGSQAPVAVGGTKSHGSTNAETKGLDSAHVARRSLTLQRDCSQSPTDFANGAPGGASATVRTPNEWHVVCKRQMSSKMSSGSLPLPRSLVPAMMRTNPKVRSSRRMRRKPLPCRDVTSRTRLLSKLATISPAVRPLCPHTKASHSPMLACTTSSSTSVRP